MKLSPWRGTNVLITDAMGFPVLQLDEHGNLEEPDGRKKIRTHARPANIQSLERLAAKVAIWIEWTAVEPGEFTHRDIHPDIREQVRRIAGDCVAGDDGLAASGT